MLNYKDFLFYSLLILMKLNFFGNAAFSAELTASVKAPGATLYRQSNATSELLGRYPAGTQLKVSSESSFGFYKVYFQTEWKKTRYAWILGSELDINFNSGRNLASADEPPPSVGNKTEENESAETHLIYISPLLGLAIPVTNGTGGPYFLFGGEIGFHTAVGDIGIFTNNVNSSATLSGISANSAVTTILLSLTGRIGVVYFGGRSGIGIINLSASSSSASLSASGVTFAVAPVVGLRFPLGGIVSLNVEASWTVLSSGSVSGSYSGTVTGAFSTPVSSSSYLIPAAGIRIDL